MKQSFSIKVPCFYGFYVKEMVPRNPILKPHFQSNYSWSHLWVSPMISGIHKILLIVYIHVYCILYIHYTTIYTSNYIPINLLIVYPQWSGFKPPIPELQKKKICNVLRKKGYTTLKCPVGGLLGSHILRNTESK